MIYHFTKSTHLDSILADGLRPVDDDLIETRLRPMGGYSVGLYPGERPVLWFTTDPNWENTIFCETAPWLHEAAVFALESGWSLIRIACDDSVAPHRWHDIKEIAYPPNNVGYRLASSLYKRAIEAGSRPGNWRATLERVQPEAFRAIDIFDGHAWVTYEPGIVPLDEEFVLSCTGR